MLIFDTMSNIVQECILNGKNDGAIFFGHFYVNFQHHLWTTPNFFAFSENILFASFHFLNQPRHVTYQMKGNGA